MQDFSSFFFPQILNSHFISVYLQPKKAHDNNTYHIGYYGSPVHLGQGEGRHRGSYRSAKSSSAKSRAVRKKNRANRLMTFVLPLLFPY